MKYNTKWFITGVGVLFTGIMVFIPATAHQASKITPIFEAGKVVGFHNLNIMVTLALITIAWIVMGAIFIAIGELKQE